MSIETENLSEMPEGEGEEYPELRKARQRILEKLTDWRGSKDDRIKLEQGLEAIDWMLEKGHK